MRDLSRYEGPAMPKGLPMSIGELCKQPLEKFTFDDFGYHKLICSAYRGDEDEPWRIRRVDRAWGYARALFDQAKIDRPESYFFRFHDHKGGLNIILRKFIDRTMLDMLLDAWRSENEENVYLYFPTQYRAYQTSDLDLDHDLANARVGFAISHSAHTHPATWSYDGSDGMNFLIPDATEWCRDRIEYLPETWAKYAYFKTEEDAVLFKMRWA